MYDEDKAKLLAENDTLRVRLAAEVEKTKAGMCSWKIAEDRAHARECEAINRAEKSEAENAALKAHVARMRGAIADMRERTNHPICISVLSATPEQSLAKLRAETLRATAKELENLRDHIHDYIATDDARDDIRRICWNRAKDLRAEAERMEEENDNAK